MKVYLINYRHSICITYNDFFGATKIQRILPLAKIRSRTFFFYLDNFLVWYENSWFSEYYVYAHIPQFVYACGMDEIWSKSVPHWIFPYHSGTHVTKKCGMKKCHIPQWYHTYFSKSIPRAYTKLWYEP